jgi:hypothetical protein
MADRHNPRHRRKSGNGPECLTRKKTMLKTFAAALIAASMLTAPALAQGMGSSAPATEMTKSAPAKAAKVHKHVRTTKHVRARHHVKLVRHVRHGRHHVRHAGKHTHAVHVARHASKIRAN